MAAAAALVDPEALGKMVEMAMPELAATVAVAVRVDRHPLLAQWEQLPLVALAAQGELQALGVLELQRL
jgi:hypothetical protein